MLVSTFWSIIQKCSMASDDAVNGVAPGQAALDLVFLGLALGLALALTLVLVSLVMTLVYSNLIYPIISYP